MFGCSPAVICLFAIWLPFTFWGGESFKLLPITVSVGMLITFPSYECVGQEVVKLLWAVCVCVCVWVCLHVLSHIYACIHFQHLCMRLFTLCTVSLFLSASTMLPPLVSVPPCAPLIWQLECNGDAFLMFVTLYTSYNNKWTLSSPCLFPCLPLKIGWSIEHNHLGYIQNV